jgi:hypothetical protein
MRTAKLHAISLAHHGLASEAALHGDAESTNIEDEDA